MEVRKLVEETKNPLNIRYNINNQWRGQLGEHRGFCKFKSISFGFRAAFVLIGNYLKTGADTIEKIISRWAPPHENNTEAYIRFVCEQTSIERNEKLSNVTIDDYWNKIIILKAMARMECGLIVDEQQINLYINYPDKYE